MCLCAARPAVRSSAGRQAGQTRARPPPPSVRYSNFEYLYLRARQSVAAAAATAAGPIHVVRGRRRRSVPASTPREQSAAASRSLLNSLLCRSSNSDSFARSDPFARTPAYTGHCVCAPTAVSRRPTQRSRRQVSRRACLNGYGAGLRRSRASLADNEPAGAGGGGNSQRPTLISLQWPAPHFAFGRGVQSAISKQHSAGEAVAKPNEWRANEPSQAAPPRPRSEFGVRISPAAYLGAGNRRPSSAG